VAAVIGPSIRLPIGPTILLRDIRFGEYQIRQDGWGRLGHDQSGNHSSAQQMVLHDVFLFCTTMELTCFDV
jgi:hypothetical protein